MSYEGAMRGDTNNSNGAAREELKSTANDVAADFAELKKDVSKLAGAIGKMAKERASDAGTQFGSLGRTLQDRATDGASQVGEQVRARPIAALGLSLGVGLLFGLALSSSRR
ncbi:MAG TPA: hypothetical protein VG943_01700 [Caulobacterales bacterium]|nr:hypothetical protein [Caulobacterales bacterium]